MLSSKAVIFFSAGTTERAYMRYIRSWVVFPRPPKLHCWVDKEVTIVCPFSLHPFARAFSLCIFPNHCRAIAVVDHSPLELRLCQPKGCSAKTRGATGGVLKAFWVFFMVLMIRKVQNMFPSSRPKMTYRKNPLQIKLLLSLNLI